MTADISRISYIPARHATAVVKQQGRVDLDADWNEQQAIDAHLRTTSLTDVIGPSGAPIDDAGLGVTAAGNDLQLSAGRLYVEGMLCENEQAVSLFDQPDLPAGLAVVLDSGGNWSAVPPAPAAGIYLAYVDVWDQHRSAVEDPSLREVALGGPDTTTRLRTVWQVRLLHAGAQGTTVTCADDPSGWADATDPSTGTLAAWAVPSATPPDDCLIPAAASYRGLDNQFYRVQIRESGTPGSATFVWSRDNGSIVASWVGRDADVLTVKSPGRDGSAGFTNGCWVQLTDDLTELRGEFGTLAQVDRVQGDELVLKTGTAIGPLDLASYPVQPRVRRWDGHGTVPAGGTDVDLELGITVRFSANGSDTYRAGDYWGFAARAAVHDVVDWPKDGNDPADVTAHGPRHAYARLAVVESDGANWTLLEDCRPLFAPLADQLTLSYLGGDGQQVAPVVGTPSALVTLGHDLVAGVSMGERPVANQQVRFEITAGSGQLDGGPGPVVVTSDAKGEVSCSWALESSTPLQRVTATLLDEGGQPTHLTLHYSASHLVAAGVAYDPAACANLAGAITVQQAIDRLCATTGGGCTTITLSPGEGWVEALENLAVGSEVAVCFKPGTYSSPRPVTMKALGPVRLTGTGLGTHLRIGTGEAGLTFEKCVSVVVEQLAVTIEKYPDKPQKGLLGAIHVLDAQEVLLDQLTLTCPAAPDPRATCATVRSSSTDPTRRVKVRDCNFIVGHDQTGVLVVNGVDVSVTGCSFDTPDFAPDFTIDKRLSSAVRRSKVQTQLVRNLIIEPAERAEPPTGPRGPFNTGIRVGDFNVRFNSAVPEAEWHNLVAAMPATAADTADETALRAYVARVTDAAAAEPARLPTFNRNVDLIRTRLRPRAGGADPGVASELNEVARGILVSDVIDISPIGTRPTRPTRPSRGVSLPVGNSVVRFDSPVAQQSWLAALEVAPANTDNPLTMAKHIRRLADRFLAEPDFGRRFADAFLKGIAVFDKPTARSSIVIGGSTVGRLTVEGNNMRSTTEAVHLGTSFRRAKGQSALKAGVVRIRGNEVVTRAPFELPSIGRAIFVGNVIRVFVEDNMMSFERGALVGIEIHGALGPHVVVRDNYLTKAAGPARTGIAIRPRASDGILIPGGIWMAVDNIAEGAAQVVEAPSAVRQSGNVAP